MTDTLQTEIGAAAAPSELRAGVLVVERTGRGAVAAYTHGFCSHLSVSGPPVYLLTPKRDEQPAVSGCPEYLVAPWLRDTSRHKRGGGVAPASAARGRQHVRPPVDDPAPPRERRRLGVVGTAAARPAHGQALAPREPPGRVGGPRARPAGPPRQLPAYRDRRARWRAAAVVRQLRGARVPPRRTRARSSSAASTARASACG